MHLDVYKKNFYSNNKLVTTTTAKGNSRPDFVGKNQSNQYNVFESKGRVNFSNRVLNDAYNQAKKIKTVNGNNPHLKLGCLTFHGEKSLKVKIKDPVDSDVNALDINFDEEDFYSDYYSSIYNFIKNKDYKITEIINIQFYITKDTCFPLNIGLERNLFELLREKEVQKQSNYKLFDNYIFRMSKHHEEIKMFNHKSQDSFIGKDGVLVTET
jgi:hypothetical protein